MDSEIKYGIGLSSAYADGYVDMLNNADPRRTTRALYFSNHSTDTVTKKNTEA